MRRSIRLGGTRLVVVLLAALIAAPQAMAAPAPADSQSAAAPSAPGGFAKESRKVSPRGTVNLSEVAARPATPRPSKDKPLLIPSVSTGGAPRGPNGLAPVPRVPGPPPVPATPTGRPLIVGPTNLGLAFGSLATMFQPPDPWIAVGPDHVVQVVNTAMRITDRQGGHIETTALGDFFGLPLDPETFNFDPRVIYDSLHGRWLVTEVSFDCQPSGDAFVGYGYLDIAVSDTADPTGGWMIYTLPYPDELPDYPMAGTSTDKVAIASNVFFLQPGGLDGCFADAYAGSSIDVLDWGQLAAAGDADYVNFFSSALSTARPALQVPATSPTIYGVVQGGSVEGDIHARYLTITGSVVPTDTLVATTQDLTADNKIGAFGDPPAPRQPTETTPSPNTIANAVDGRPTDALWQGGRLVWVSTIGCTTAPDLIERDCVRVSELNTTTVQRRQDFVIGQPGKDIFHGGIGLSMNGALHVTYTLSSATDSPGTHAVYQLPGDATNAVSQDELVRIGEGPYTLGERWGDYTGVAQDPQDPNAVWQTNEFSNPAGTWSTHFSQLSTAVGGTYVPITPERVLDTRSNIGLSSRFAHGVARSWQVTGIGSIPLDAVAVTGNVTVVGHTGAGHVSVTPRPTNTPTSSSINFPLGDVRANNVTIPLSPTGKLAAVYISSAGKLTHLVFDVTGYFRANDLGATYNAVDPERVLDTRTGIGLSGRYRRDIPRSFQVSGNGGVPAGAVAVTGNLTVTGQTASGHVALTPTPNANPATSTLNFPVGDSRANGLTIPLSPTGKVSAVYKSSVAGSTTNLIFDVTGYYLAGTSGFRFYSLNPGRRMDTRTTVMTGLSGRFFANTFRNLRVAGFQGVPWDAKAITGNLTVTQPTKPGHLALTPTTVIDPPTSTINFPAGDTRANGVTERAGGPGDIWFYFKAAGGGTVHAILDITGYFR
jgi:hypothetical protein